MSSIACPKCGANNAATARFCGSCGNPLGSVPPGQETAPQISSTPGTSPPGPYYGYAASYYETERTRRIDGTKTGLLLIAIGFFTGWIPYFGLISVLLELVGAVMVILGRDAFGREHARNVIWSIIIFVIATAVAVGAVFAIIFSTIANYRYSATNPVPPNFAPSLISTFTEVALVGYAIFGIAQVLFTYALQKRRGRILLWCGYVAAIASGIVNFLFLNKLPYVSIIPSTVLGIIFGYAYYLARERIVRGEIPAPPLTHNV